MEKLCKNCKHWKRRAKGYGECRGNFFFSFNEGEEVFAKLIKKIMPKGKYFVYLKENVYEHQYDEYDSRIISSEDFGCIYFQPIEESTDEMWLMQKD